MCFLLLVFSVNQSQKLESIKAIPEASILPFIYWLIDYLWQSKLIMHFRLRSEDTTHYKLH